MIRDTVALRARPGPEVTRGAEARSGQGTMRIDQVLHWLCLVKSRSQASRACREGRILVGGEHVRPAREIRAQDEIALRGLVVDKVRVIRIERVPQRQQSRTDAADFYTVVREEPWDPNERPDGTTAP